MPAGHPPPRHGTGALVGSPAAFISALAADGTPPAPGGAVSRAELFATLYLLVIANALAVLTLSIVRSDDAYTALVDALKISDVLAVAVGFHLLRQMPEASVRRGDWLMAAAVGALLLIPHQSATWLALIGMALYAIGRDRHCAHAVASGSVFVLLAVSAYWGPMVGQALGADLVALDAALAAALLDSFANCAVNRVDNLIITSEQTILVMFGCSSLPNLLHGLLWYTVIARALRPEWRSAELLAMLVVGGLVLAVNTVRLALMGLRPDMYQWVHSPVGANVFNIGLLLLIAAIALYATASAAAPAHRGRSTGRHGEPAR